MTSFGCPSIPGLTVGFALGELLLVLGDALLERANSPLSLSAQFVACTPRGGIGDPHPLLLILSLPLSPLARDLKGACVQLLLSHGLPRPVRANLSARITAIYLSILGFLLLEA